MILCINSIPIEIKDKEHAIKRMIRANEELCALLNCRSIDDLNILTESQKIRELIRINEELHEKHFEAAADDIIRKDAKIVMIAGPSSSGKTTSANRLCTQLKVHGKHPILISIDDYGASCNLCT